MSEMKIYKSKSIESGEKVTAYTEHFVLSREIAEKVKDYNYCKILYGKINGEAVVIFKFKKERDDETLKLNRRGLQVRISAVGIIRDLELKYKKAKVIKWIRGDMLATIW